MIDEREYAIIERRNMLRDKVIRVDDFKYDFGLKAAMRKVPSHSPAREGAA